MQTKWVTDVRDQAAAAGVAFHFKQWGESRPGEGSMERLGQELAGRILDGRTWNEAPVSAASRHALRKNLLANDTFFIKRLDGQESFQTGNFCGEILGVKGQDL